MVNLKKNPKPLLNIQPVPPSAPPSLSSPTIPSISLNLNSHRQTTMRGGQNYVSCPPSFSNDGTRLLVGSGASVSIFSTATALHVSSLEGHTATVTSVAVVPGSNILSYCWTSSLDGTIRYWNFSLLECIKTIDLQLPIFSMVIPSLLLSSSEEKSGNQKNVYAYVSMQTENDKDNKPRRYSAHIKKCNLTSFQRLSKLTLKEIKRPQNLTLSPCGKYMGMKEKRTLHIWKVPKVDSDNTALKKITLHHTKAFAVVAFHPTERIVAAGDVTGRILIFRGFGAQNFRDSGELLNKTSLIEDESKPGVRLNDDAESCSTWHWHSAGVNLLSFSSDGVYLYSGGKEGVLVLWQLDTGKKKFLPRIGSPLRYFIDSPDPSFSSISCADNQIHILKTSSMEVIRSISGIKPTLSSPEICESISSQAAFDRTSGLVAVQTENYGIQFYSLFGNRGLYEVQVCERNYQPVDEVTVVVTMVELSIDGSMMGTVEVKLPEEGIGGLVCLKFWDLYSDTKRFSMSTLIYEPHRDAHISAIAFHPTRHMAVSTSYGGDFKIWVCREETQHKDQKLQNFSWTCHAVGSYKNKAMRAAAFSGDGSVLAVAADTVITLWDPVKNELIAVVGETPSPIGRLSFVGKSDYLLSVSHGSTPQLSVWSMSKLAASWSIGLQIEAVSCSLNLSYFAVIALLPKSNESLFKGDGIILVFNAADPTTPVASWSVTKAKGGSVAFLKGNPSELAFGKSSQTLLAYLNGDREYVLFDLFDKEACELNMTMNYDFAAFEENGQSGYTSIYGELPKFDLKRNKTSSVYSAASNRPWETIFSGSSHMLPPLSKLCSEFLESLLEKRTSIVE